MLSSQRLVEAADQRRHRDDRRDADDDAEHRQARAHLVGAHGLERHDDDFAHAGRSGSLRVRFCSFASQRLDRIQPRGADRRIQAEEQSDERRDADAERDRPQLDRTPESA